MTRAVLSPGRSIASVVAGGVALAGGAIFVTAVYGEELGSLARGSVIEIFAAVLLFGFMAWLARRLVVGKLPDLVFDRWPTFLWSAFRISLVLAVLLLILTSLLTLALGYGSETPFFNALLLLLVVQVLTGLLGGAIWNILLTLRHWRTQSSV